MQIDQQNEINKFNSRAHEWWDENGEFRTLHQINPIRLEYVKSRTKLENQSLIDIGCGGGIFSESLARAGAIVTGIDLAPQSIEIAKLHLYESNLDIKYECLSIEEKIAKERALFDILTCMEMLEHVPDPEIIIAGCAKLLKPGGVAFLSTLNRNFKSYALGIIVAEYMLKLLPKGTHDYKKFIKPSELKLLLAKHNLQLIHITGLSYNPITNMAKFTQNTDINYIVYCRKI